MSLKTVTKYDYLQNWEISSNTALLEFKGFHFTLSFFQALFKRWINNKIKFRLVIFTSYFLSCPVVLYYTQFNETL